MQRTAKKGKVLRLLYRCVFVARLIDDKCRGFQIGGKDTCFFFFADQLSICKRPISAARLSRTLCLTRFHQSVVLRNRVTEYTAVSV